MANLITNIIYSGFTIKDKEDMPLDVLEDVESEMNWEKFMIFLKEFLAQMDEVQWLLAICESIFFINLILNFFL